MPRALDRALAGGSSMSRSEEFADTVLTRTKRYKFIKLYVFDFNGGYTRKRTLDPLIERHTRS
jgi:hypothetical protein